MIYSTLKKLLALLVALALGAALAEAPAPEAVPAEIVEPVSEAASEPILEAAPADAAVPEQAETALPTGDGEPAEESEAGEIAPEAWEGETAVEAPAWQPEAVPEAPAEAAPEEQAVSAPAADVPPVLAAAEVTLGVKDQRTLTLANGAQPQDIGAAFASSNPKIAAVDPATGVVTGKKAGSATITLTAQGVESACAVTVVKAPKKLTLSAKKLSMGVGEEAWLGATLNAGAVSAIAFSSSNPGVVAVDGDGHLTATGAGTAKVTAMTYNKKKAVCKVTVLAAPEYVALGDSSLSLWQGRSYELKPMLSPGSGGALYCASSDPGVVSVSGTTIRAEALGSATVTVSTYNGHSASVAVKVTKTPFYRALLVGETRFPGTGMSDLPGDRDVALVTRMLSSVKGPSGSGWAVSSHTNLTASQIHSAIRDAFAEAQEGDVSLFYISTHGDETLSFDGAYPEYAGYLQTYPDYGYSNWYDRNALTLVALASWLSEVPGQVVVLIDSCGSGAAIYNAKDASQARYSPESFDAAVVDAFRDQDKGVLAPGVDQGAFVLENKFYVLTSSDYLETGWSLKGKYSYFSKWLTDAVKTKGRMPADADKNHYATLDELYRYMSKLANKKVFKYNGYSYRQHVQVYPAGSGLELFYR